MFGEIPLGSSIVGKIWLDANDKGVIDPGENLHPLGAQGRLDTAQGLGDGIGAVTGDEPGLARAAKSLLYKISTLLPQAGIDPETDGAAESIDAP